MLPQDFHMRHFQVYTRGLSVFLTYKAKKTR